MGGGGLGVGLWEAEGRDGRAYLRWGSQDAGPRLGLQVPGQVLRKWGAIGGCWHSDGAGGDVSLRLEVLRRPHCDARVRASPEMAGQQHMDGVQVWGSEGEPGECCGDALCEGR